METIIEIGTHNNYL